MLRADKATIKQQTLHKLHSNVPSFIHVSEGKLHDVNALYMIEFEAGSF